MLRRVLVANRGEIACRVLQTANRLGLDTVALYSDPDLHANHVKLANKAYALGGVAAADSYLNADKIIQIAKEARADAIHPGYGFLSENAEFADAVRDAKLVFIGPPAEAIRSMGAKDASKRLMEAAGVPLLPGYHGEDQSIETIRREAERCGLAEGLPVMLKAVLGGGGKGMRIVESAGALDAAVESARREAEASFGDGRILIERYLPRARHIEVQVFCDTHGGAVHLFERDCSVQRRHQKVLEEAGAHTPGVDQALRDKLGAAAVRAAKAVGYVGAGTVEFIADAADASRFYFMEMNTRLQVEHPVTEMVTGVDLVEWQLRVAAGEPLPTAQVGLELAGHAIEARIYAERPGAGFLPAAGTLRWLRTPPEEGATVAPASVRSSLEGAATRVDTGVSQGDEVTPFYDPMIAKLIVRGPDRAAACRRLHASLDAWQTVGVPTNVAFLRRILETDAFSSGDVHTAFIDQHQEALFAPPPPPSPPLFALAAAHWLESQRAALAQADFSFRSINGAVVGGGGVGTPLQLTPLGDEGGATAEPSHVYIRAAPGSAGTSSGREWLWSVVAASPSSADGSPAESSEGELRLSCEGGTEGAFRAVLKSESLHGAAVVEPPPADEVADGAAATVTLFIDGEAMKFAVRGAAEQAAHAAAERADTGAAKSQKPVHSPMPGKIVKVLVEQGASVREGEALLVLEAMKMEHTIYAAADAVVDGLHAGEGDVVGQKALLLSFKKD